MKTEFRRGIAVRIKPGIEPTHGWGRVKPGDVGVVMCLPIGPNPMKVHFPAHFAEWWSAVPEEMEIVQAANEGGA